MENIMNLNDLVIPSYPEERINLNDPSEAAYIDDLAVSLESDLTIINGIVAFESLDITPFTMVNYDNMGFGLEASKFVEAAKQTYYKLKQRAKQFIKFAFGFFLNFLRGSTDVKAVIEKYSKKLKTYKKAFDDMRRTDDDDKDIEIRDVRTRIGTSVVTILILTGGLELLMNEMYSRTNHGPESKILCFATAINVINGALVSGGFPNKEMNEDINDSQGDVKKTKSMERVRKLITEIFNKKPEDLVKEDSSSMGKIYSDNNKSVKDALAEAKEMYKEKVESQTLNHSQAYEYMSGMLKLLTTLIDPKLNNWDFKKISQKVAKIDKDLVKQIDKLGDEGQEDLEKNKSTASAVKIVMNAGSYLNTSKNIVSITLKTFKSDMEVFFTECGKVGSILHKKQ